MTKQTNLQVDDRFLRQVYQLTVILGGVGTPFIGVVYGLPAGVSFLIGSIFSLGAVLSLEFVVRRLVKPGGTPKTKRWFMVIMLGKYTVFFGGLYFLMKADWLNVYALAAGVGLVQAAIILKAIKLMTLVLLKGNESKNH
jgi:hypothetical protein